MLQSAHTWQSISNSLCVLFLFIEAYTSFQKVSMMFGAIHDYLIMCVLHVRNIFLFIASTTFLSKAMMLLGAQRLLSNSFSVISSFIEANLSFQKVSMMLGAIYDYLIVYVLSNMFYLQHRLHFHKMLRGYWVPKHDYQNKKSTY